MTKKQQKEQSDFIVFCSAHLGQIIEFEQPNPPKPDIIFHLDGKIIGCVSEERFSRIKNHFGFPFKSIEYLLKNEGINGKDIDYIISAWKISSIHNPGTPYNTFQEIYSNKSFLMRMF